MEERFVKECWKASGLGGASICSSVKFSLIEGQLVAALEVNNNVTLLQPSASIITAGSFGMHICFVVLEDNILLIIKICPSHRAVAKRFCLDQGPKLDRK
jgi:hypothetical protein